MLLTFSLFLLPSSTSTSFAQPSGISLFTGKCILIFFIFHGFQLFLSVHIFKVYTYTIDSQEAYVADSESSSIRALDLKTGGSRLLAGGDPVFAENLFRVPSQFFVILLVSIYIKILDLTS